MKPSRKNPAIDTFLDEMFGVLRINDIEVDRCVTCGKGCGVDFPTELYKKEFSISGMCPTCQDNVFSSEDGDR
jgi:Zn ribbon nucleic-acid-binding protein